MSERKLAHVERIVDIQPIQGADRIEVATVLGWQCVVKKDEFKVGDLVVYIEIDSIVPAIPYFDFMRERNYRVRTIKLRKQISQGLVISLNDLNIIRVQLGATEKTLISILFLNEGDVLTESLGITKYESPSDKESSGNSIPKKKHPWYIKWLTRYQWFRKLTGMRSKSFPDWIKKTDETRIQNIPNVLKESVHKFYSTEKLDGQSATYWYKHHWLIPEFGVCSRNVRKSEFDGSNWSKVAKHFNIKAKLKYFYKKYKRELVIQGEILAPTVQGNKYKVGTFDFYVFNIFDIKTNKYLSLDEIETICYELNLKVVPIIDRELQLKETVQEMVELSKGKSTLNDIHREGIVVRSYDQSISFKVINPEFLLKYEEETV